MATITCPDCKQDREIKRINPNTTGLCHVCAQARVNALAPRKRYFRICLDCGETKQVRTMSAGGAKRCRPCSDKAREKQTFIRTCEDCKETLVVASKQAAAKKRCKACASIKRKPRSAPVRDGIRPSKNVSIAKRKRISMEKRIAKAKKENKEHKERLKKEYKKSEVIEQKLSDEEMIARYYADKEAS